MRKFGVRKHKRKMEKTLRRHIKFDFLAGVFTNEFGDADSYHAPSGCAWRAFIRYANASAKSEDFRWRERYATIH